MCQFRWVFKLGVPLFGGLTVWSLFWSQLAAMVFAVLVAVCVIAADFPLWCERRALRRKRIGVSK